MGHTLLISQQAYGAIVIMYIEHAFIALLLYTIKPYFLGEYITFLRTCGQRCTVFLILLMSRLMLTPELSCSSWTMKNEIQRAQAT